MAKEKKQIQFCNYCLSCSDPVPPDKDFCDNDICENNFYDDSHLERELDEALAEQEQLKREDDERWERQTKCLL